MLKSIRKVFIVFLSAVLCLSSIHLLSSANTSAHEVQKNEYISALKTAWENMYQGEVFASFDSNSKIMNQNNAASDFQELSSMGITFNTDGTFNKAKHENHFGGLYQYYGVTFNKIVNNENKPFTSAINGIDGNSFNEAFSNDSLYFTFNPGTVTNGAEIWVLLQYNGTGYANVLRSQIKITPADSGKDIIVDIKDLTYNCRNVSGYDNIKFSLKNPVNDLNTDLCAIKIFFHHDLDVTGASISPLQYRQQATLPDEHADFGIIEWYNAAANFDITGYTNTEDFTAAVNSLKDFIDESCQKELAVYSLKTAWSEMTVETQFAAFDSNSKIMNQNNAASDFEELSSMGITFNTDGTFNKAKHENHFGGLYQYYGVTFNKIVNNENKPFTSAINSTDGNSFNEAFSNDSLYFTFNPGTVTNGAEIWVLLQYNGTGYANVLRSQIKITPADSGKDIKVDIKDLTYNCRNVSGYDNIKFSLKNPVNDLNTDLCAIKIFFHHNLDVTGARISPLQSKNTVSLPEDYKDFGIIEWYNAAANLDISGYKNTDNFTVALQNLINYVDENCQEDLVVAPLKNAWSKMLRDTEFGNFHSNSKVMNQKDTTSNLLEPSQMGITFNADGTFDKSTYEGANFGGMYYLYGMTFNKDVNGVKNLFTSNINSIDNNSFNAALNNDSLNFTFNPGTVTTAGNIRVYLQYNGYGNANVFYSKIDITADDSNKDKKIVLKDLTYKCASTSTYSSDWKLTKLSDALKHPTNKNELVAIKIFFNPGFVAEGASISPLRSKEAVSLPEGYKNFTALQWYHAASDLSLEGIDNTDSFTAALENVRKYLVDNNDEFAISLLQKAWTSMYKMTTVANLRTEDARNESGVAELSTLGISFTDITNSEAGYVFNKTAHESSVGYNNFLIFNSIYWDNYTNKYKFFDSGVPDNSFNKAFTDNDDIVITFNTGEVKTAGKIRIVLRYKSWNTVYREIGISESNKEIKLSFKELFGLENLSDALTRQGASSSDPLIILRIAFSSELETESAKVYPLKTLKYADLPENTDGFTAYDWLDAAQSFDYSGYFETEGFVKATEELEGALYTPVEIAEKKLRSAWGKMYTDTFFASLTGKDNKFDDSKGATGAFINNDVKVSADDIAVIGDEYTAIDKAKGTNMRAIFHDRGGKYQCLGVADKVKNYDTIVVNIYTGNITNNGTMYVYLIDQSWKQSRIEYPLSVNDSNKWIEVDLLKELGYADMEAFSNPGTDSEKPSRLDLGADSALGLEGMVVGMFAGRTYCPTPSEDISAEELLNIALELDIEEYSNTDGFISGMKALYKAIHGVELPDLSELNFFDSKANVEIHIERQSRIDDSDVVGIKSTENNISQELSKWIADAGFKAIENTYKIELVNSKGKIADIGNREVTVAFNLPSGVEANEVNLLEMNGDNFKLINCVYYEDKLVFDTKNFINGKSYAILVLS